MKIRITLLILFSSFVASTSMAQIYAVEHGIWDATSDSGNDIWSTDKNVMVGTAGLRPSSSDNVFTNGKEVTVGANVACKNLAVSYNVSSSLIFISTNTITVTGALAGWDDTGEAPTAPDRSVFSGLPQFTFTAANVDGDNPFGLFFDELIAYWNKNTTLGVTRFSLTKNSMVDGGTPFADQDEILFESIVVSGGTSGNPLELVSGFNLSGIQISGSPGAPLRIAPNTTLYTSVPIYGTTGGYDAKFGGQMAISGTLRTSSFVNATSVSIASAGTLIAELVDPSNQTEGWWYRSNRPDISTSAGSTVKFSGSGDQKVLLGNYSNLVLEGSGSKELVGTAGAVTLSRSLTVASGVTFTSTLATQISIGADLTCNGTWNASIPVVFNGASPVTGQTISGSGTLAFNSLQVSNNGISLLLNKSGLTISNGITIGENAVLNVGSENVTLSGGNISNSGTITTGGGTSTLLFTSSGATNFTGVGAAALNNVSVSNGDLVFDAPISLKDLSVSNSTASVSFGQSATVTGSITNAGSIEIATVAVLTFSGGSQQTVTGNGFSVYDMVIDKSANTLSNNTTLNLYGNLTMNGGTFDMDGSSGSFVLISDTNRDATIGKMTGGLLSGEATVQRYFNNTTNRWRNMAFPVTGVTLSELQTAMPVYSNSISYYDETTPGNIDQGWKYLSNGNLIDKKGYSIYMYNAVPITVSVKGPLVQTLPALAGSFFDFGVTYTNDATQDASQNGWNLVANPFVCPIDWNDETWVKTDLNSVAAIWDATTGAYRYSGTSGWDGVVAQGQAFWVQTNGDGAQLQCSEDVKRPTVFDPSFFRVASKTESSKGAETTLSRLSISLQRDTIFDETIIQFKESSSPEFDARFDAYKLKNEIFNLSSLTPYGGDFAINVLPRSACHTAIPLNVSNIPPGSYKLNFGGLSSFDDGVSVSLWDDFTQKETTLPDGHVYSFEVTSDVASFGSDRFVLRFHFPEFEAQTPQLTVTGRRLASNIKSGLQWLFNGEVIEGATGSTIIAVAPGVYQARTFIRGCQLVSESVTIEGRGSMRAYPNPADYELRIPLADLLDGYEPPPGAIYIYSSSGQLVIEEKFSKNSDTVVLDVSRLKPGLYLVKIRVKGRIVGEERIVIKK